MTIERYFDRRSFKTMTKHSTELLYNRRIEYFGPNDEYDIDYIDDDVVLYIDNK